MTAMLRLPRGAGVAWELPDDPRLCETCRGRRARADGYCGGLCRAFDEALGAHAAAIKAADGDRLAAPVVLSRTRLRAVAALYDRRRLVCGKGDRLMVGAPADWAADVADGLLLAVAYVAAVREARERIG